MRASFSGLAQVATPSTADRGAATLISSARAQGERPSSLDIHQLVRASTKITVALGSRVVCLGVDFGRSSSSGCGAAATARNVGTPFMSVDLRPGERYAVTGLVPDGVERMQIRDNQGRGTAVRVRSNIFTVTIDREPVLVSWKSASGDRFSRRVHGYRPPARLPRLPGRFGDPGDQRRVDGDRAPETPALVQRLPASAGPSLDAEVRGLLVDGPPDPGAATTPRLRCTPSCARPRARG